MQSDDDKKRLADDAERDRRLYEETQKKHKRDELQLRLNNCKREFDKIQADLQSQEMKFRGAKSSNDVLKREILDTRDKEQRQERDVNSLKSQLEKSKQDLERIQTDLTNKQRQADNFEIEEKKLEQEVNKLKEQFEAKKREMDDINSQMSQIR
jgi:chromosome segregation ATPase